MLTFGGMRSYPRTYWQLASFIILLNTSAIVLGAERSEDMLTWNVFRSLQEAGCLGKLARAITGDTSSVEPFLFLWGICLTDDDFNPWDLLIAARKRFEPNLPVVRPLTEPDIGIMLPGRYLILIEAKFTSPNTIYQRGPRKNSQSLTLDELLGIYHDPNLRILDHARARPGPASIINCGGTWCSRNSWQRTTTRRRKRST